MAIPILGKFRDGAWIEHATGIEWQRHRDWVPPDEARSMVDAGVRWVLDQDGVRDPVALGSRELPSHLLKEREVRLARQGRALKSSTRRYVPEEWRSADRRLLMVVETYTGLPRTEAELRSHPW